jgi:thiosulfate dehydrogenase [quinone] large subunit
MNGRGSAPISTSNLQLGYFAMRVMLGINLCFHGIMRPITGMTAFVDEWEPTFADTFLPLGLVRVTLFLIPVAEGIAGLLTLLGLFTRAALVGGVAIFALLLAGHSVRSGWAGNHTVMQYALYYGVLLALQQYNWLALDNVRAQRSTAVAPAN